MSEIWWNKSLSYDIEFLKSKRTNEKPKIIDIFKIQKEMNRPKKLYSKQHDSYCTWNGIAYENDGKVPGARFYGLEKAKNCGFEPIEE